jgi:hypothetical protein
MFSKEEAVQLRKEFWTSFGKSFPRKWLLYNTKIKGFTFKFVADKKKAMVCLDIEHTDEIANELLYDQMISLKVLLETEIPEVIFNETYELESGKIIRRINVAFNDSFSIHNKNTWRNCYEFYVDVMSKFELFFYEYEDFINQAI